MTTTAPQSYLIFETRPTSEGKEGKGMKEQVLTVIHDWESSGLAGGSSSSSSSSKLPDIAGLFLQLAESTLLGRLASIDQAGRHLDADLADRSPELSLQQEQLRPLPLGAVTGLTGFLQHCCYNANAVNVASLRASLPFSRFPCPHFAARVAVRGSVG